MPGTRHASGAFSAGTATAPKPAAAAAATDGKHAANRPQPAVEPQLAEEHQVRQAAPRG